MSVSVSNACGVSPARQTVLTVYEPTAFNTQPVSQSACIGSSAAFSVGAIGSSLAYQWKKTGNNIAGATSNSFTISSVTAADAGNYSVDITGVCGRVTSSLASLTIKPLDSCVTAVSIINNPIEMAAFIPNLITDQATLKVVVNKNVKRNWCVLDLSRKTVMKFHNQPGRGENYYMLSFQNLPGGVYFIRGVIGNITVEIIKFVKI